MTLAHKKIGIIQEIASSEQEELIHAVEEVLQRFSGTAFKLDLSNHLNLKKKVVVDDIIEERPIVDFDMNEFAKEAGDLQWDKSINQLLAELD